MSENGRIFPSSGRRSNREHDDNPIDSGIPYRVNWSSGVTPAVFLNHATLCVAKKGPSQAFAFQVPLRNGPHQVMLVALLASPTSSIYAPQIPSFP